MTLRSNKPYYSSIPIMALPILVFCLTKFLGFYLGRHVVAGATLSSIFHFLGGMSVYLSASGVLWHLIKQGIIKLQDSVVFHFVVLGSLGLIVIAWEIYEYIFIFPYYPQFVGYVDTIMDMIAGLAGGLFAIIFVRKPII